MWAMEMTVAATYHGNPMKEQAAIRRPTQNRSRWYPQPFCLEGLRERQVVGWDRERPTHNSERLRDRQTD